MVIIIFQFSIKIITMLIILLISRQFESNLCPCLHLYDCHDLSTLFSYVVFWGHCLVDLCPFFAVPSRFYVYQNK